MTNHATRHSVIQTAIAILGTGAAFAFLEAGAFRELGGGTLHRMLAPAGLRAAALGAGVTAALLIPAVIWLNRRSRRGGETPRG